MKRILKKSICEKNYNFISEPDNVREKNTGIMVKSMREEISKQW